MKRRRILALIYILLLSVALTSCTYLVVRSPVGDGPITTKDKGHPSPDETDKETDSQNHLAYEYKYSLQSDLPGYHVIGIGNYKSTDIAVPRTYEGKDVTCIAANSFSQTDITSLSVEKRVRRIDKQAFEGCDKLVSVSLIGEVAEIEERAFAECTSLASFNVPYSVTQIGEYAFSGCTSLEELTFTDRSLPLVIEEGAFQGLAITSVTIPKKTTINGVKAFGGCVMLTEVTIEDTTPLFNPRIFTGCTSLKRIYFAGTRSAWKAFIAKYDNNKPSWCADFPDVEVVCSDGTLFYGENQTKEAVEFRLSQNGKEYTVTFLASLSAKNIVIPATYNSLPVTSIADHAFEKTEITSVTLPSSIKSIGYSAFRECKNLTSINLPDSLETIKDDAFYGCKSLSSVSFPSSLNYIGVSAFNGCESLLAASLPEALTNVKESTFKGCTSLASASLPSSLIYIGNSAFEGCAVLSSVALPETLKSIGTSAFKGCASITSVTLPRSLTSIGASAFSKCTSLQSVTFPEGTQVTYIPEAAFSDCKNLITLNIPKNAPIKSIGAAPFYGCKLITKLVLPDAVQKIESNVFSRMESLKEVHIPRGVSSVSDHMFLYIAKLETIYYGGTLNEWNTLLGDDGIMLYPTVREVKIICSDGEMTCTR